MGEGGSWGSGVPWIGLGFGDGGWREEDDANPWVSVGKMDMKIFGEAEGDRSGATPQFAPMYEYLEPNAILYIYFLFFNFFVSFFRYLKIQ